MSLRAIPLSIIPFVLYNVVVVLSGADHNATLRHEWLPIPLMTGTLKLSTGDIIIFITMICLFIELIKSTFTSTTAMIDHGLSMLIFIACLVEFLIARPANSAVFFFITIATLIDVVAGFMIGMRTARRDLNIGTDS